MRVDSRLSKRVPSLVYDLFVRTRRDGSIEIFTIDYGGKLGIYDTEGHKIASRAWSPEVRSIAIGDVDSDFADDVIAGTKDCVIIIGAKGNRIAKIERPSPVITCDAADIDGDCASEVIAALQNNEVTLWNDETTVIFSRKFESPVTSVRLENMTDDEDLDVVVIERKGRVTVLSASGHVLKEIELDDKDIRVATVLDLEKEKVIVTGGPKEAALKIWNVEGHLISRIPLPDVPHSIDANRHFRGNSLFLVVGTQANTLEIIRLVSAKESAATKRVVEELRSTKKEIYRRPIRCGYCGAPVPPDVNRCPSCGAYLESFEEEELDKFITETISSVLEADHQIKLNELDRIVRRTLPAPRVYNLRRHIQSMVKQGIVSGHFRGCTFIATTRPKPKTTARPLAEREKQIRAIVSTRRSDIGDLIDIADALSDTDIDHELSPRDIRHALILLMKQGEIEGEFVGRGTFLLTSKIDDKTLYKKIASKIPSK
ncbi:MAG: zinc ribbon domain-containing protein [Candidatus Thorarchaeota archaeon]|nr:zinc ribbon domain-containing protein [Candidatus Thorarchaeota archaeon]